MHHPHTFDSIRQTSDPPFQTSPYTSNMPRPLIVLVDDDRSWASAARDLLSGEGFDVESAADGASGLKLLERTKPTLVILDVQLPRMNGLEILRELRRTNPEVPVVMTSGEDQSAFAANALAHGACSFLRKPIPESLLLKAVQRYISR